MDIKGFGDGNSKLPSVIKDPFSKNKIKSISVTYQDFWSNGKWEATGRVQFKNGNTEGEQKFEGTSFDDVVMQIKAMLDNFK